jgi:hypothetical protein
MRPEKPQHRDEKHAHERGDDERAKAVLAGV